MARIAEEELEQLKRDVPLAELVRAQVDLTGDGDDLVGLCPFHNEDTPSFHVSVSKNLFHCFGCNESGSVVDWVMKTSKVSFRHAVELLRGKTLPTGSTVRALPPPVSPSSDEQQLLDEVCAYYQATLKESPEALAYLKQRGLHSPDLIDHFKLGYANRTLGLRIPLKNRKEGALLRENLQRVGIYRESGHEHFNGSLVIPILDDAGHVQGMYGRKLLDNLRPGTPLHMYLSGPHRGVFNIHGLKNVEEVVLCEALIDALTFWDAGFHNVTAAYGADGFTDDILAALTANNVNRVHIAFDRDDAGDKGAQKAAALLMAAGIDCYRVHFPAGTDANEHALKNTPARQALEWVLQHAVNMNASGVTPATSTPTAAVRENAHAPTPQPLVTPPVVPAPMAPTSPKPSFVGLLEVHGADLVFPSGDRSYRIRGFGKSTSDTVLKVNITARRGDELAHTETLDLMAHHPRLNFIKTTALELSVDNDIIKKDVGKMLLALDELRDCKAIEAKEKHKPEMTPAEREAALEFLKSPDLLTRLLADFETCGVVGEETNKLVGYLGATSRKLPRPLAVIVKSDSGSGKSSLVDAVLRFMPEEDYEKYSTLTEQALYYMTDVKHKIIAVAEEEGAERAAYALKLLQSEGGLRIASPSKDPHTGLHQTHKYEVEGPAMIFLTTTRDDTDNELLNRCIELTADESREQTRAIHAIQRKRHTSEWDKTSALRAKIIATHKNAQRLLEHKRVWNPFTVTMSFPDDKTRLRRDHEKYLVLMDTLALLHQYQRPTTSVVDDGGEAHEAIHVTAADVELANKLANEVLGKSLDELPPQTRRLLTLLNTMVAGIMEAEGVDRSEVRFSRKEVRQVTSWRDTQLRVHLDRLVQLEYLLVHRGARGQSFVYELVYDGEGQDGKPFVMGLVDLSKAAEGMGMTANEGNEQKNAGSKRGQSGPITASKRVEQNGRTHDAHGENDTFEPKVPEEA